MNSDVPKIPLLYVSLKNKFKLLRSPPNDWQKIQSQEILEGPAPFPWVIKPSSFCGLGKMGQGLGLRPRSMMTSIFQVALWLRTWPLTLRHCCSGVCVGRGHLSNTRDTGPLHGLKVLHTRGMLTCARREKALPLWSCLPPTLPQ